MAGAWSGIEFNALKKYCGSLPLKDACALERVKVTLVYSKGKFLDVYMAVLKYQESQKSVIIKKIVKVAIEAAVEPAKKAAKAAAERAKSVEALIIAAKKAETVAEKAVTATANI